MKLIKIGSAYIHVGKYVILFLTTTCTKQMETFSMLHFFPNNYAAKFTAPNLEWENLVCRRERLNGKFWCIDA